MMIICNFISEKETDEYYVADKCYKNKRIQGVAMFADPEEAIKYADDYSCKDYKIEIMEYDGFACNPYYNC